ncbi:MAG: metallophosphoesterase, partial [Leptospiraceae bacterium]|nr:metallophosphoesterase [Leptospiraceae bacterium]
MNQLMKILRPESATESYADLPDRLIAIYTRTRPPRKRVYNRLVNTCTHLLLNEDPALRPRDARGRSGGIVNLHTDRDTIIVPDLHGRMDLILNLLFHVDVDNKTILEQLIYSEVQIVCVGDGMHAEARAAERWQKAREEFIGGYWRHRHMDAEMRESLGVMQMVMELKGAFPDRFHYLKGNHDNILNERGNGNYPFMKFALEGPMVTAYMHRFYGAGLLHAYADFERNLPLLAIGSGFLISHAEPTRAFERDAVLNYRERPDVVEGLTWTADGQADSNAVSGMLRAYLPPDEHSRALHFG